MADEPWFISLDEYPTPEDIERWTRSDVFAQIQRKNQMNPSTAEEAAAIIAQVKAQCDARIEGAKARHDVSPDPSPDLVRDLVKYLGANNSAFNMKNRKDLRGVLTMGGHETMVDIMYFVAAHPRSDVVNAALLVFKEFYSELI